MEETEVIYIGRRMTAKGKTALAFITPAKLEALRAEYEALDAPFKTLRTLSEMIDRAVSVFEAGRDRPGAIGGRYRTKAEISEDGSISRISFNVHFIGLSGEGDLQAAWRAADRAAQDAKAMKSAEAKANESDALARAVKALRQQYQGISPMYRRGFQLWLLEQLEKR